MAVESGDRSLKETPTWAVAAVCAVIVLISVGIEHAIHYLRSFFQKRQKKAMLEALEKIKAELMLLGFISLLLTVGQQWIAKICVSTRVGHSMLPCRQDNVNDPNGGDGHKRRLLWELSSGGFRRRLLAAGGGKTDCSQPGTVPLISQTGIHQLHIFIFVLAIFHILYSVLTMGLAHAKMKKWKAWESETSSLEYQFSYDPSRFRLTHQTSFVKRHAGLSSKPGMRWIVAFFRQLYGSVSKVDYLTLRHGFVIAHLSPKSNFNFHKYIKRSLEDDFKVVVGISLPLWLLAVTMMLLNVYGWYTLYWLSLAPLVILLMVGSKLELVIMRLAHQIQDSTTVVKGAPIVQPSNELFWFNRPEWILLLIHLTIFENAFQMAYFVWIMCTFKGELCFHAHMVVTVLRVVLGLALQFLCSYSTFPLYALVTQMGSHMKKTIFEEQTAKALDKWRKAAKERKKQRAMGIEIPSGYVSGEATPSRGTSPLHLLHKHTTANAGEADSVVTSPFHNHSDTEVYEMEPTHGVMHLEPEPVRPAMDIRPYKDNASIDFSFSSRY